MCVCVCVCVCVFVFKWRLLFSETVFGLSLQVLCLLHHSFSTITSVLWGLPRLLWILCTLCQCTILTLIQDTQRSSVIAGLWSKLHLIFFNYSESAVSQLNGFNPDRYQVQTPCTACAWLLFVQYHVHLDLQGLALILCPAQFSYSYVVVNVTNF
jgi:hypothetical protein